MSEVIALNTTQPARIRRISAALMSIVLACLIAASHGFAANRSTLKGRLEGAKKKVAAAKQEIVRKREAAHEAKNELIDAQQELAAAESRLSRARRRLEQTREELIVVRRELAEARARLAKHQKAMSERILSLFRQQEPCYLEVVLRSTSFEDFASRTEFTKQLCAWDEQTLTVFASDRAKIERQQALLEKKEAEQKELEAKVARERKLVAAKAAEAKVLRDRALNDLAEAERQYQAQVAASRAIEAQLAAIARGVGRYRHEGAWSGSLLKPVAGPITSSFGYRIHPILRTRRFHNGIDISAPGGSTIRAADSGTVISAGWQPAYGLTVVIDHGSGVSTMYAHCQRGSIQVSPGQRVSRGQPIAAVDSTGWSTGNHLHWTVYRNGSAVNPVGF